MTKNWVTAVCLLIVMAYANGVALTTGRSQGWPGSDRSVSQTSSYIDYVPIWSAGRLALEGRPAAAYDWSEHSRESFELLGRERDDYQPWGYPPTFLAVSAFFSQWPYGTSMMVWVLFSFALYAATGARILGDWRGAIWMSTGIAGLFNAILGQNGTLSAALMGSGLVLLERRPLLAGVMFGALTYKPHLGLLIPIALAAAGYWRTVLSAAVTALALALGSAMLLGTDTWAAFLDAVPRQAELVLGRHPDWLQSIHGFLSTLGAPRNAAMAAQILCALAAAGFVGVVWRAKDVPFELKAAALAAASLLVSPYLFNYDLTLQMVACAFLLRWALARSSGVGVILAVLIAANVLVFFSRSAGLPLGFLGTLLIIGLIGHLLAESTGRGFFPIQRASRPAAA